jgi:DNA-binding beta-propeller fold protein YncE
MTGRRGRLAAVPLALALLAGCSSAGDGARAAAGTSAAAPSRTATSTSASPSPTPSPAPSPSPAVDGLPGMPPVTDPSNVYADAGAGMLSATARTAKPLVYVPDSGDGDVRVIDPATFKVLDRFHAGIEVQHVVPAYDMRTLYATDDIGNTITPIDPRTGAHGARIPIADPYNMYFWPDGSAAVSVAEARRELVFYDWHTWKQQGVLSVPGCAGIDHADFTMDGRTAVFTCEFAGRVAVVDVASRKLLRTIDMPVRNTHMGPQDIKLAPDGRRFYVADSDQGGLWVLDGAATKVVDQIPLAAGTHGIYPSRNGRHLYVTNRIAGSVSVLDPATGLIQATWPIPHGSPDMGGVTADGSQLWLSGRYNREVYVLSTATGHLLARIPVGDGPHGLCVWPQPGRYSLGHTGITR